MKTPSPNREKLSRKRCISPITVRPIKPKRLLGNKMESAERPIFPTRKGVVKNSTTGENRRAETSPSFSHYNDIHGNVRPYKDVYRTKTSELNPFNADVAWGQKLNKFERKRAQEISPVFLK